MARTKDLSGIDKVPFVERKFEGAAWSCAWVRVCMDGVYNPRGHMNTTF
jgi:hypothetical protein